MRSVEQRLGGAPLYKFLLRYVFPDHWSFLLGEIALYAFLVLVGTGIFLTLYYIPSDSQVTYHGVYTLLRNQEMSEAYRSVLNLTFNVPAGLLLRQVHHWAADVFIAAIVCHLVRIFFTGAYRKPRDFNYYVGLIMLMLAILEGFAGYSLVDDLLSGMGLAIANGVALSIPLIGGQMASTIWGGQFPGTDSFFSRLEIVHVLLIPAILGVLISIHLAMIMRQHHSQFPGRGRAERTLSEPRCGPLMPCGRSGCSSLSRRCCSYGRAHPDQPDLAVGPVSPLSLRERRSARLVHRVADRRATADAQLRAGYRRTNDHPQPVLGGVLFPLVVFGVLFAWPSMERRFTRDTAATTSSTAPAITRPAPPSALPSSAGW